MRQFAYGLLLSATLSASASAQQTSQAEVARLLAQIQATLAADANGGTGPTIGAIPDTLNTPTPRSVTIGVASKQYPVEPPEPPKVIRAYDLADLFAIAPSARAVDWISDSPQPLLPADSGTANNGRGPSGGMSGGMSGGGMGGATGGGGMGGMMNISDDNQIGASINGLIDLLEATTDGEWDSEEETITQLGGTLVVRATENSQRQIESLLNLLSQRWNSKVVMRTEIDYVYLNKEESKKVQSGLDAESEGNEKHWAAAEWNDFRDQLSGDDRPASYHVRLTGFNGQHLAWTSGEQHRTVSDVTMGRKGRLESLSLSHPHSGVVCETRTSLSHNKDMATLNVASRLLRAGAGNDAALAEPASGVNVDRQSTVGQSIAVSTRIPLDTVSLIAIGTDDEFDTAWQLHIVASIHEVKKP